MMEDTGAGMGAGTAGYAGTASNKGTGIKAALATVHGVGEMVRGEFNAKMDEMGGDVCGFFLYSFPCFGFPVSPLSPVLKSFQTESPTLDVDCQDETLQVKGCRIS
jgi:hypothetical protein